jgi:hypothetical protein
VRLLPLAGTVVAAMCFGVASVLESVGAQRVPLATRLDAVLLVRLVRQPPYALGLALDVVGFALTAWALRSLPLFVVQAGVAASLAVTAVVSSRRGDLLPPAARLAVVATGAGLVLLGSSAGSEAASPPSALAPTLLVSAPLLLLCAAQVHRRRPTGGGTTLSLLAGLAFAGFALAGRVADLDGPATAVADPGAWALVAYLLLGLLLHGASLQRAPVTSVTAVYVAVELLVPAVVGITLVGDAPRPGAAAAAAGALGFTLVVASVWALARTGGAVPAALQPSRPVGGKAVSDGRGR